MGTPEFAVPSLNSIIQAGYQVVGVITAPDKPSGRGRKIRVSAVKEYAQKKGLRILQPGNLKSAEFIDQLTQLKPDLQIVVAFRMLPKVIWEIPRLGTFNLHASLLPQYRGAAPINHAIINGEKETGITTFLIDEKIDTGRILMQQRINISGNETAGTLHDKLMQEGSALVLNTVDGIIKGIVSPLAQTDFISSGGQMKNAPKIFKEDCKIDWEKSSIEVDRFIRGMSPFPGAFSYLISPEGKKYLFKVFKSKPIYSSKIGMGSSINTDGKSFLKIETADGFIQIVEIKFEGKRSMKTEEFLRGFSLDSNWNIGS